MAKKTRKAAAQAPSKFQAVVKFFEENPDGANEDAVAALKQQGLKISPRYVAQIKSKAKLNAPGDSKSKTVRRASSNKKKSSKPARQRKVKATPEVPTVSADAVVSAVRFVDSMGGIEQAREALQAAEKVIHTIRRDDS